MVICPNCGQTNDNDALFCRFCGMKLFEKKELESQHNVMPSYMDININKRILRKYNPHYSVNNEKNSSIDKNGVFNVIPANENIQFTTNPRQNGMAYNMWSNIRIAIIVVLIIAYIAIMFYSGFNILSEVVLAILFPILIYLFDYFFSPLNIPDAFVVTDKSIYLLNTSSNGKTGKIYHISNIKKIDVLLQNVIEKGLTEIENSEYDNIYHDFVDYTVKEDYTNEYDKIVSFNIILNNNKALNLLDMHILSQTDIESLNKLISIFKISVPPEKISVRWLPRSVVDKIK